MSDMNEPLDGPADDAMGGVTDLVDAPEAVPAGGGRKAAVIVLCAIVALLAVVFIVALSPKGTPADGILPADPTGYQAPALTMPRLDGQGDLSLSDYSGKPVVVNFWASWCTTCKAEAQVVADAEKKWRDQGVVFIGIDTNDQDDPAKEYEKEYGVEYVSVVDPAGSTARTWRVTGYPETFFISPDGRIISKFISSIDAQSLDESIAALLP